MTPLRIGTRGSRLALAQARAVAAALAAGEAGHGAAAPAGDEAGHRGASLGERRTGAAPIELVTITTAGDVDRARGDKSRWTGALEAALVAGDIDLAVHSAKDVPGALADGTVLAGALRRADPYDVLVGEPELDAVREGARVGTSALRRRSQLLAARPDLQIRELRGNVDTRLAKRAAGEVDVLVLAAAGLVRLGRRDEAGAALTGEVFVPAAGQGVIAVQARTGSPAADAAFAASHTPTMAALTAERAAVRALSASCHAPVGIHAEVVADGLEIRGFAGLPDGSAWIVDECACEGDRPAAAGAELARRMIAAGAADLLRDAERMVAGAA